MSTGENTGEKIVDDNNKTERWLFLDDERVPADPRFDVVKSYDEFVEYILKNGIPEMISFDHDLADEHYQDYAKYQTQNILALCYSDFKEKTGLECAKWLGNYILDNQDKDLYLNRVGVHSMNPLGRANIQSYINGFKKHMGWEQSCFTWTPPLKDKE